jgi:hypothetical protein
VKPFYQGGSSPIEQVSLAFHNLNWYRFNTNLMYVNYTVRWEEGLPYSFRFFGLEDSKDKEI